MIITSSMRENEINASIYPWVITHTGQSGPEGSDTVSGRIARIPLLKIAIVRVPQTSIRRTRFLLRLRIRSAIARDISGSLYSSMYLRAVILIPPQRPPLLPPGPARCRRRWMEHGNAHRPGIHIFQAPGTMPLKTANFETHPRSALRALVPALFR